jgi:hypothetical protein
VSDVNIYYAYYRAGSLYRANGTRIGSLGQAISPSQASKVYDTASKAWVDDVALDAAGRLGAAGAVLNVRSAPVVVPVALVATTR